MHLGGADVSCGLTVGAIAEIAGDIESCLTTLTDELEAFAEAGNNTLKIECSGATAIGGIEYLTVEVLAGIVDYDSSVLGGFGVFTGNLDKICKA